MTSKLEAAIELGSLGFYLFPVVSDGKKPAIKGWQEAATRNQIAFYDWFVAEDLNIGISTSKFRDNEALLVVDVDVTKGKDGNASLIALELQGLELPETLTACTASGGKHLFFSVPSAVRQGANVLGAGLDIRSRGGYVLGVGSSIGGRSYDWSLRLPISPAPEWLIERCGTPRDRPSDGRTPEARIELDGARALDRAISFLRTDADPGISGSLSDTSYRVAAKVKDFGVSQEKCVELMLENWPCSPPMTYEDMATRVRNAYSYGNDAPGSADPAADFTPVALSPNAEKPAPSEIGNPWAELNKRYAFVAGQGSHIIWETEDVDGKWQLQHLDKADFHDSLAARKVTVGEKMVPLTKDWIQWDGRRTYQGLVFRPEMEVPETHYNLWKGFSVEPWPDDEPVTKEAQEVLDDFLRHMKDNVCNGSDSLYRWLLGYFAHIVQKPYEKPLVALVFHGSKGVGKNAVIERIGGLLGSHSLSTSDYRYLVGNFNSHLEHLLLFVLDEAFWSGDRRAEGVLKNLITGTHHVIERKGHEPFKIENRTRVVIIGNEEWLVPASHDERRFAVFHVGEGNKQDRQFFERMKKNMEAGGYRLLLRYLQGVSLKGFDPNEAPQTRALLDQKHATLSTEHEWWLECLTAGRLISSDFGDGWPERISTERFRAAVARYAKERNVRSRVPSEIALGKAIRKALPAIDHKKRSGNTGYDYVLPSLADCRAAWDKFIGHEEEWG